MARRFKITVYVKITERSIQGSDDQTAQPCMAIQRLCKLLSTNTEAHVQAHIIVVENLINHKTKVVFKLSEPDQPQD